MKKYGNLVFLIFISLIWVMPQAWALPLGFHSNEAPDNSQQVDKTDKSVIIERFDQQPVRFVKNQGQTDLTVKYLAQGKGYTLFLTQAEIVMALGTADRKKSSVVRLNMVGAQNSPRVTAFNELPGKINYFIGNDVSKWRTNVPTYARVKYEEIYPGVDLVFYGNQNRMEYDFIVSPGVSPDVIRLSFQGVESLSLDQAGNLVLNLEGGRIVQRAPRIYQNLDGDVQPVTGGYVLSAKNEVGFEIGTHDPALALIIDPIVELAYSTYLGGSEDDEGYGIAIDSSGNAYVAGSTESSDFPTKNGYQATKQRFRDAFVTKLAADGSGLVYSTFLGGEDDVYARGIAVDSSGYAYVAGYTDATDFPTQNPYQTYQGNEDVFFTKLTADGSGLVYSTYLGGPGGGTDYCYAIAIDPQGNAYLTGSTMSSFFPTKNSFSDRGSLFVAKLDPSKSGDSSLVYSSRLGYGEGRGIAVDSSGVAYVTGNTSSSTFPTQNPFQTDQPGFDAFVIKLAASGSSLIYSTYLGGSYDDYGRAIAIDSSGNMYVTGYTASSDFPTQNPYQTNQPDIDVFVTKLEASGAALVYSTYLGGTDPDWGSAIAVDSDGNAYVAGYVYSRDFPLKYSYQDTHGGGSNSVFVAKLTPDGSDLAYSTYLGGGGQDEGYGIAVDSSGNAYVTGSTGSTDFPIQDPYQTFQPGFDAFVTKLFLGEGDDGGDDGGDEGDEGGDGSTDSGGGGGGGGCFILEAR